MFIVYWTIVIAGLTVKSTFRRQHDNKWTTSHGNIFNTFWLSHPFVSENVTALVPTFKARPKKKPTHFADCKWQNCNADVCITVGILYLVILFCLAIDFNISTRTILHRINCAFQLNVGHGTKKKDEEIETEVQFNKATPCPCHSKIVRFVV